MNTLTLIAATMLILVISIAPAYAYLDPGTGSMLIQGFIAAVAAGAMVIKLYWYKIKAFLFRRDHETTPQSESPVDDDAKKDDGY
jgi:hypothetical protein